MKNTVWQLTFEVNEYDQQGKYAWLIFKDKPTREKLQEFHFDEGDIDHLLNKGGGRQGSENTWYWLEEVELL